MQDKCLSTITDELVDTGKFLGSISHNPKRVKCLDVFIECQTIVKWIREATTGMYHVIYFILIFVHV